MTQILELSVPTNDSGSGQFVIVPQSAFWTQSVAIGQTIRVLPFCVAARNPITPYDRNPGFQPFTNDVAPYVNQAALTSAFAVDCCKISFQQT